MEVVEPISADFPLLTPNILMRIQLTQPKKLKSVKTVTALLLMGCKI